MEEDESQQACKSVDEMLMPRCAFQLVTKNNILSNNFSVQLATCIAAIPADLVPFSSFPFRPASATAEHQTS